MAYLNSVKAIGEIIVIQSSASPEILMELFKERVDFSKQPRKPLGTMSIDPPVHHYKFVGTINSSQRMTIRYESEYQDASALMQVRVRKGNSSQSEIEAIFKAVGFSKQDKIAAIGALVLFWGMLLSTLWLVHEYVSSYELQRCLGLGFLVTAGSVGFTAVGIKLHQNRETPYLNNFLNDLVSSAESRTKAIANNQTIENQVRTAMKDLEVEYTDQSQLFLPEPAIEGSNPYLAYLAARLKIDRTLS